MESATQNNLLEVFCSRTRNPFDSVRNKIKNLQDLLESSNHPQQMDLFGGDDFEAEIEELERLYNERRLYRRWAQKTGPKTRYLAVPNPDFARFIKRYILPTIKRVAPHDKSHGGERGWSPKASLQTHLPFEAVLSFDLSSAFNNVGINEVFGLFYQTFPQLNEDDRIDFSGFLATLLTTTYDGKRAIPQGAPHSMPLFNRILRNLDVRLGESASAKEFNYTRWVDDITISSPQCTKVEEFLGAVDLTAQRFPVARHKIFFQEATVPVYLLGHVIEKGRVYKNSPSEREANKVQPLDYDQWFGDNSKKNYRAW